MSDDDVVEVEREALAGYGQRPIARPSGATEVLLVRHGETIAWHADRPFALTDGHGDPELSASGRAQAVAVGERLAGEALAGIYVTPLRRTRETAQSLLERLGREATVAPDLIEVHLGDWEAGEYRMRMTTGDEVALRALREERWELIPGGERDEDFRTRIRRGISHIAAESGPGTVAAFVHAAVVAEAMRAATGSRPFAFLAVDNASITRIVVHEDGRWQVRGFNDVAHLR